MRINRPSIALLCLCIASSHAFAQQESTKCQEIRLAESGWTDNVATTGVAMALAQSIGYMPKKSLVTPLVGFSSMKSGRLDAFLGGWSPSLDANLKPFLEEGSLYRVPTPNLEGAKYTLAVPNYAAEKGLRSFQDIAKFKDELGGRIYGLESGADGNKRIKGMIEQNLYNLGGFNLIESSEAGMRSQVARAISQKKPIVFLGWEPHPMNLQFKVTYLSGGDEVFGPDFGAAKVYTITSKDYSERCPNAARLISNLKFTTNMESEIMVGVLDKQDPIETVKTWLKKNPQWLNTWLEGVTTFEGEKALPAAQKYFGL